MTTKRPTSIPASPCARRRDGRSPFDLKPLARRHRFAATRTNEHPGCDQGRRGCVPGPRADRSRTAPPRGQQLLFPPAHLCEPPLANDGGAFTDCLHAERGSVGSSAPPPRQKGFHSRSCAQPGASASANVGGKPHAHTRTRTRRHTPDLLICAMRLAVSKTDRLRKPHRSIYPRDAHPTV